MGEGTSFEETGVGRLPSMENEAGVPAWKREVQEVLKRVNAAYTARAESDWEKLQDQKAQARALATHALACGAYAATAQKARANASPETKELLAGAYRPDGHIVVSVRNSVAALDHYAAVVGFNPQTGAPIVNVFDKQGRDEPERHIGAVRVVAPENKAGSSEEPTFDITKPASEKCHAEIERTGGPFGTKIAAEVLKRVAEDLRSTTEFILTH